MTCNDCKQRFECSYSERSHGKCAAFETKHKPNWISKGGFTAYQSGKSWNIWIIANGEETIVGHFHSTKRVSKRTLKKKIDQYLAAVFEKARDIKWTLQI